MAMRWILKSLTVQRGRDSLSQVSSEKSVLVFSELVHQSKKFVPRSLVGVKDTDS